MMKIYKLFFFTFFFISCQREIEINLQNKDSNIVINSLYCYDSLFTIQLTESRSILDSSNHFITDANVELYENDIFIAKLLYYNNGIYKTSDFKAKENRTYKVKVNSENFSNIEVEDYMPKKVAFYELNRINNVELDNEQGYYSNFSFKFSDNYFEKNFYEVMAICYYYDSQYSFVVGKGGICKVSSDNPIFNNEGYDGRDFKFYVFSDELFNGDNCKIDFKFKTFATIEDTTFTLFVYLNSVSENYYKYKKSLLSHLYSSENLLFYLPDPIQLYTNVENGFGIFAGYNCYVDSI